MSGEWKESLVENGVVRCPKCKKRLCDIKEGLPITGVYTICPRCGKQVEIKNVMFIG